MRVELEVDACVENGNEGNTSLSSLLISETDRYRSLGFIARAFLMIMLRCSRISDGRVPNCARCLEWRGTGFAGFVTPSRNCRAEPGARLVSGGL